MESFRRNLSENIFSKTGIFQNGIFQKESFRIDFMAKPESFRMESFRRNHSENIFSKTGIFQNEIFQLFTCSKCQFCSVVYWPMAMYTIFYSFLFVLLLLLETTPRHLHILTPHISIPPPEKNPHAHVFSFLPHQCFCPPVQN
jgi:hypothetical protein